MLSIMTFEGEQHTNHFFIIANEWIADMYSWRFAPPKNDVFQPAMFSTKTISVLLLQKFTRSVRKINGFSWDVSIFPGCREPVLPNFPGEIDFQVAKWLVAYSRFHQKCWINMGWKALVKIFQVIHGRLQTQIPNRTEHSSRRNVNYIQLYQNSTKFNYIVHP